MQRKGPIQTLYDNSALLYVVAFNFVKNTISTALNSNWYNLASMLQCNVIWKLFHT